MDLIVTLHMFFIVEVLLHEVTTIYSDEQMQNPHFIIYSFYIV